jgi:hypothetical protein
VVRLIRIPPDDKEYRNYGLGNNDQKNTKSRVFYETFCVGDRKNNKASRQKHVRVGQTNAMQR